MAELGGDAVEGGMKKMITHNGVTRSIKEWTEYLDVPESRIRWRLRRGWPMAQVLSFFKIRPGYKHTDSMSLGYAVGQRMAHVLKRLLSPRLALDKDKYPGWGKVLTVEQIERKAKQLKMSVEDTKRCALSQGYRIVYPRDVIEIEGVQ